MKKNAEKKLLKIIIYKITLFLIILFIKLSLSLSISQQIINWRKIFLSNEIILTIKGPGEKLILNNEYKYHPFEIEINGEKIPYTSNSVDLPNEANIVKLYYNSSPNTCKEMFKGLSDITKIDFSNFDTSNVKDMSNMFNNCGDLEEINMKGINTSSVTTMESMFQQCIKLKSLDLSDFDTSSVNNMKNFFSECRKLEFLDVSNFNTYKVEDMSGMFQCCEKILSIDISNFEMNEVNINAMFKSCYKVKSIILSKTNNLIVKKIEATFQDCKELTSLDLSNLKFSQTKKITNMAYLFDNCHEITYIELPNLDTSLVTDFTNLFSYCSKLVSLDLSKFDTSNAQKMDFMFRGCNSLIYLNINMFSIKNGTGTTEIFPEYSNSLRICNNEESVSMLISTYEHVNNNCNDECFKAGKLIIELNKCVKNCNEEENYKYEYNKRCYNECPSGTSSSSNNIYLCKEILVCKNYYNIDKTQCFDNVPEGYYIKNINEKIIDKCYNKCKECNKNGDETNNNCLTCKNNYKFYNGNCLSECPNGYYNDGLGKTVCKCIENSRCKECTKDTISGNYLCISCNDGYYKKYGESNTISQCFNGMLKGYYLDDKDHFYKECYKSCEECSKKGDEARHNCDKCIINYDFIEDEPAQKVNCYEKCSHYYYFKTPNEYFCTQEKECPSTHSKFIVNKKKCVDNCNKDKDYPYEYNNICYKQCPENTINDHNVCINKTAKIEETIYIKDTEEKDDMTNFKSERTYNYEKEVDALTHIKSESIYNFKEEETEYIEDKKEEIVTYVESEIISNWSAENFFLGLYNKSNDGLKNDDIINNIREDLINHNLDSLISNVIKEKEDVSIRTDNTLFQITTSENQNNNAYSNVSSIQLGECEEILKDRYNVSKNGTLIILKIDYNKEGLLIPIIGYEVYHPLYKYKLNLSYCDESSIIYNIPVTIEEDNLFKYDPNSEYYTDECSSYASENGADMILNDRKDEFIEKNMSLCENMCEYNGYNQETKKAICECGIKYKEFILSEIDNKTDLLANDFTNDNTTSNLATMKCSNLLFSKQGLLNNIGSYILSFILVMHLVGIIFFYKCGFQIIESSICDILSQKKKLLKAERKSKPNIFALNQKIKISKIRQNAYNTHRKKSIKGIQRNPSKRRSKSTKSLKARDNSNISSDNKSFSKIEMKEKAISNLGKRKSKALKTFKDNSKIIEKLKNYKKLNRSLYDDYELNTVCYKEALENDKRTLIEIYISFLKIKHPIIFSFFPVKDYNVKIIKMCIFLFSFVINYAINGLFFSLPIIHKIYLDGGSYNLSYLFPIIFYSFIISYIINIIIMYVILSERNLVYLKRQKTIKEANQKAKIIKRCLIIKNISYFILSVAFIAFFWYYLSSFGAVYQNSQFHLIKNAFISFTLNLIFPFIINIIPAFFRKLALTNKNRECIYNFSIILIII